MTVSLLQAAVASLVNQAANYLSAGIVPQPIGSEHPNIAPYGTVFYDRGKKPLILAVGTDSQFRKLCEELNLEVFATAPTFATNQKRVRNRALLNDLLSEQIALRDREELVSRLLGLGVPASPVNTVAEAFRLPEAESLVLKDPANRHGAVRSLALQSDILPLRDLLPPPAFGEHTQSLLDDLDG